MSDLVDETKNPIRLSISDRTEDISWLPGDVTMIAIKPSEGNIYVHWEEP